MGIRNMIVRWLDGPRPALANYGHGLEIAGNDMYLEGDVKLSIRPASNGRLLVAQIYKPVRGPGPDWETTLHLVPDGSSLVESIARVLVLQKVA
jgi:hypothetical protein